MTHKTCPTCGKFLPATEEFFGRHSHHSDGLTLQCRKCLKEYRKYLRNPEAEAPRAKLSRVNPVNEAKRSARRRELKTCPKCGGTYPATTEFFHRHRGTKDGLQAYCKPCQKDMAGEWRRTHPNQAAAYARVWRERHRAEYNEYMRQYWKRRCQDPRWRLSGTVKRMLWYALGKARGHRSWEDLVGYTADDLVRHFESLFEPWMNWENYASKVGPGWEIDHVRPQLSFRFSSPDDPEFKECWALSNLRPLWIKENRRRRDREALTWEESYHAPNEEVK